MLNNKAACIEDPKRRHNLCPNFAQKKGIPSETMYVFISFVSQRNPTISAVDVPAQHLFKKIFIYPHNLCELLHTPMLALPSSGFPCTERIKIIPDLQTDKRSWERKNMSTIYSLQPCLRGCTVCFWGEAGRKTHAHVMSILNSHTLSLRNPV